MQSSTEIYERRMLQLQALTGDMEAPGLVEQVNKCIEISNQALATFLELSQLSMDHLRMTEGKKSELNEKFGNFLRNLKNGKDGLSNPSLSVETRQKMAMALDAMLRDTSHTYEKSINATRNEQETFKWCYERLDHILFHEIFLPDPDEFDVENALGQLKELIQKIMPYSEELDPVLDMNVLRNHHSMLQDEDELIRYLENYPMLLGIWIRLAEAYKKFVNSKDPSGTVK